MTNQLPGAVSFAIWPNTTALKVVGEAAELNKWAVDRSIERHPDIGLSMWQMPDLDGF